MSIGVRKLAALVAVLGLTGTGAAVARTIPEPAPELPVLHEETKAGAVVTTRAADVAPSAKTVDGNIDDWSGTATGLGGQTVHARGELIYTDHVLDAYGADDGGDRDRLAQLDPLNEAASETYRLEPIFQADLGGEFGVPLPEQTKAEEQYGDLPRQDGADLLELRVAADANELQVLARTTNMATAGQSAVLLLADTAPGSTERAVPFGTGLHSSTAEVAILLANGGGKAVDLLTGTEMPIAVAVNPSGYTNAIEAAVPLAALGHVGSLRLAAATGAFNGSTFTNVANVAFRGGEPVRVWFDKRQALALLGGSIDEFFSPVVVGELQAGRTDAVRMGPGYYERIFASSASISTEGGQEGVNQHYGVWVPSAYGDGANPVPMTVWLHWRGGKAHSAASLTPRIMRDFGEAVGGLVVSPRGRGSSSWYVGRGQYDVDEVYADATELFNVNLDKVYVTGHSMGGWGTYLSTILHPDRYAAGLPVAGPVTQGAWTGADFEGCDEYKYDEYSFCYIETNSSNPRVQHTRRLLPNLRNVPLGIFQGAIDELVPVSGVTRQAEELVNLGYRHRYYLFPTYEHYSHPVVDEWAEGVRYMHQFTRDPNPARVTYIRDMPFERSVESGPNQQDNVVEGSFDFDHAYWMSELTPADGVNGVARFDGTSLARPAAQTVTVPEAGGPASLSQVGPYAMTGLAWLTNPLSAAPAKVNGFQLALSGASAVRLDLARMGIDAAQPISATVTTDTPLELRLGARTITVAPGTHTLVIT
jgi:pimeloyl-ACP methyl ester carboxylesterase